MKVIVVVEIMKIVYGQYQHLIVVVKNQFVMILIKYLMNVEQHVHQNVVMIYLVQLYVYYHVSLNVNVNQD